MAGTPTYDIEENLRRIDMQRTLKFIVVEGSDDVPIYENIISASTDEDIDFDVIHSGGKPRIKTFINENPSLSNCIFIIDRDFDVLDCHNEKLVHLERYSIENFYFCEDVLKAVVAMSIKLKLEAVKDVFNMDEFIEHSTPLLIKLFHVVYYYQTVEAVRLNNEGCDAQSWSDAFICKDNSWNVCPKKVDDLITKLYPNGYDVETAEQHYSEQYNSSGNIIYDFPGKMLKVALQRYLKDSVMKLNTKLGSKFSNTDVTCTLLMSNLHRSKKLQINLTPVYEFLNR
ncbi:DUF4435 domain-containing protein [Enterobacter roggenkampii]|uniref:DUF4435 domain-containing protein n=1 Tax=Enterobacter roggenkampii TaxID=1812935 RepID=UPI00388D87A0